MIAIPIWWNSSTTSTAIFQSDDDCCNNNDEISTEELKALTKVKQGFDKPDNMIAPFIMMSIPKTNKRLSQLRQRHTK